MTIEVKKETWKYHFVGSDITYIYNHIRGHLDIYSESLQKNTETINIRFKDFQEFEKECKFAMIGLVKNIWGLN